MTSGDHTSRRPVNARGARPRACHRLASRTSRRQLTLLSISVPYRIDIPDPRDDVLDCLVELGALDAGLTEGGALAAVMPDAVTPARLERALGTAAFAVSPATGRDDDSVWIVTPGPIQVAGVRIVPAGATTAAGDLQLIDTTAFGTGLHPTTALCVEALAEAIALDRPEAVLDVGTGSGVLALAALTMGVPRATGVDVEPAAIRAATTNARLNLLDERFTVVHGGADAIAGTWPLVVANVVAAPLIEMAPALVKRLGHRGELILSGVPTAVETEVEQIYRRLGMQRVRVTSRGGWVAIVMRASW